MRRTTGWTIVLALAGACSGAAPHAACPVERALSEPVVLEVQVEDELGVNESCTDKPPRVVQVGIDRAPWCRVTIPCTTVMQSPPRAFTCKGPPVAAGAREIEVQLVGDPASDIFRTMSLPAFDRTAAGFTFGANVRVWVSETQIVVDPPTASAGLMM